MSAAALYIHVPFCLSKCAYCDFASTPGASADKVDPYLETLRMHLERWAGTGVFDGGLPSLYIGGGTPTLLGEQLIRVVSYVLGRLGLEPGAEVTVETNPETTDPEVVAGLVGAGVNRFSLGVQSFDPAALRYLGRCHDAASAEQAARVLRDSCARFSIDLICGVPGLSEPAWRDTLKRAVATGADHVSVYPLTVEDDTPLAARIDAGASPDTDPDRAAADMVVARDLLTDAGFHRYEVANYARPGCEARHNLGYWTARPYVGIGPSAAGMLPHGDGRRRFAYPRDLDTWLACDPLAPDGEYLSAEQTAREDVMLALRLATGVPAHQAAVAGVSAVLEDLAVRGLVERVGESWRTTERGWLLGNEVFQRVLFD